MFIMGGFEIDRKIGAMQAYEEFPERRLRMRSDGQLTGNIIIDKDGQQHCLDDHHNFENRITNYVVGGNPIALKNDEEIEHGQVETLNALCEILKKDGKRPIDIIGRWGHKVNNNQITQLRDWLSSLKAHH